MSGKGIVKVIKLAVIQSNVTPDKCRNICDAVANIAKAKQAGAQIVVLPECFNSPYDGPSFAKNAECLPCGETMQALCRASAQCAVFVVGGTIPELCCDNSISNTATVWNPTGQMIAVHRKVHMYDVHIPGRMKIKESAFMRPGDKFTCFCYGDVNIGLGVGYDIRFHEMSHIMARKGAKILIYPSAFNTETGPKHMELLCRTRALDHQLWVVVANPAKSDGQMYTTYGNSVVANPDGEVVKKLGEKAEILMVDINLDLNEPMREAMPIIPKRRLDFYDTVKVGPGGYCAP